jgi:hypothetical protein
MLECYIIRTLVSCYIWQHVSASLEIENCKYAISLTLNPLTWKIWWAPNNASKWQMGFNSTFKGLITLLAEISIFRSLFALPYAFFYSTIICVVHEVLKMIRLIETWCKIIKPNTKNHCHIPWSRGLCRASAAAPFLELRFWISPGHECLSLLIVMRCQVDVSMMGWSLVQSLCVISKTWKMSRPRERRAVEP